MNDPENGKGLSDSNRYTITTIFFIVLLIWGPIEPYGIVIRIGYLIAFPTFLWLLLGHIGKNWRADSLSNDRLGRGIAGVIAGVLFVLGFNSFISKSHLECTQEIRTRDGTECVGEYKRVSGSDNAGGTMEFLFGGLALWYAIARHED